MSANPVVMMLTDGRFPSGGHAYSAGMEQAIAWGDVVDLVTVEAFVVGRVASFATMAAEVVATANVSVSPSTRMTAVLLDQIDDAVSARMASSAARTISREQGRRWLRAVGGTWPGQLSDALDLLSGRHGLVVLGAATAYLGVAPQDGAAVALYDLVGSPVTAAVRLLGLDPISATSLVARLVANFEPLVHAAAAISASTIEASIAARPHPDSIDSIDRSVELSVDLSWISWLTAPLSDLAAEAHLEREERLFAS